MTPRCHCPGRDAGGRGRSISMTYRTHALHPAGTHLHQPLGGRALPARETASGRAAGAGPRQPPAAQPGGRGRPVRLHGRGRATTPAKQALRLPGGSGGRGRPAWPRHIRRRGAGVPLASQPVAHKDAVKLPGGRHYRRRHHQPHRRAGGGHAADPPALRARAGEPRAADDRRPGQRRRHRSGRAGGLGQGLAGTGARPQHHGRRARLQRRPAGRPGRSRGRKLPLHRRPRPDPEDL